MELYISWYPGYQQVLELGPHETFVMGIDDCVIDRMFVKYSSKSNTANTMTFTFNKLQLNEELVIFEDENRELSHSRETTTAKILKGDEL